MLDLCHQKLTVVDAVEIELYEYHVCETRRTGFDILSTAPRKPISQNHQSRPLAHIDLDRDGAWQAEAWGAYGSRS